MKNWNAIHEMAYHPDGSPKLDDNGKHQRKYKYIINTGSSRSSKTVSLIDCYDLYARENNNKRLTVWRDTKTDCKKTVLNDAVKHFTRTGRFNYGYTFNATESIFKYKGGSTFEIHGTDDVDAVHGLEQDAAWLNEPYKISRDIFDQIDQRTSDFIFIDWNPKKAHWIEELKKDPRSLVIHSTFKDNPFCPAEQRTKILSYQPVLRCDVVESNLLHIEAAKTYDPEVNPNGFTDKQCRELFRCQQNEYKGTANDFNWSVYGLGEKAEQPNRIFKWSPILYGDYLKLDVPIYIGVDWGEVDPWGIIEVKYYDGALYLHELNYLSQNQWKDKLTPTEVLQIQATEEGMIGWMFGKLRIEKDTVIVCDNNRQSKIIALRDSGWEYALAAIKPPGSIIDGVSMLGEMRVYYTHTSENIKYEQENYSRKVDRYGIILEEPEDIDNHTIDPARYVAQFLRKQGIIKTI